MASRRPGIVWQDNAGELVVSGRVTVTPHARLLRLDLPIGTFVWQRPSHVLVERDGHVDRLAVVDVTRRVQLGLLALGIVAAIVGQHRGALRRRARRS